MAELQELREEDGYKDGKVTFNERSLKQYRKTYGIVGNHSGVQVCSWTKKAIKGEAVCYKQKFYGIDCHNCAQMSPALAWCTESCVFCWRPSEWMKKTTFGEHEVDDPEFIIKETIKQKKRYISGLGGAQKANKTKWKEAFNTFPSHWAISLSGEPTIYPRLGELIKNLKARNEVKSVFVVSNGQDADHIEKLLRDGALPTQLYISLTACDEKMFKRVNRSIYSDGWQRLIKTFRLFPKLNCRKVIRFTLIKDWNDQEEYIPIFANIIENSKTDFVELKSYMALGFSRRRLSANNMLTHDEIRDYTNKLLKYLPNYLFNNEDHLSRITLLKRNDSSYQNMILWATKRDCECGKNNGCCGST